RRRCCLQRQPCCVLALGWNHGFPRNVRALPCDIRNHACCSQAHSSHIKHVLEHSRNFVIKPKQPLRSSRPNRTILNAMLYDERPWGSFTVLDEGAGYKVKRIEVHPQKRLSYQKHQQRSEHWMVVAGSARVTLDGREITVETGETIDIAVRAAHRIEN